MAYASHSQYRAYPFSAVRAGASRLDAALLIRIAFVAVAAAAVIVALSGVSIEGGVPALARGDRLPARSIEVANVDVVSRDAGVARDAAGRVVYLNDPAARTTTVSKGATVPLAPNSPLNDATK